MWWYIEKKKFEINTFVAWNYGQQVYYSILLRGFGRYSVYKHWLGNNHNT